MMKTNDKNHASFTASEQELGLMDKVRLVSDPSAVGIICNVTPMGSITRCVILSMRLEAPFVMLSATQLLTDWISSPFPFFVVSKMYCSCTIYNRYLADYQFTC